MGISIELAKQAAAGRWPDIIPALTLVTDEFLRTSEGPCPKCGGKTRFRIYEDFAETGGCFCNQCNRNMADGFSVVQWATGCSLDEAITKVCDHLGVTEELSKQSRPGKKRKRTSSRSTAASKPSTPAREEPKEIPLTFQPWREKLFDGWAAIKKPITADAVRRAGGQFAKHYSTAVIAIPVYGKDGTINGYAAYNASGGTIPYKPNKDEPIQRLKVKLVGCNRHSGWMGQFRPGQVTIKAEGVTDMLAILSCNPDASVISNPFGAGENPLGPHNHWMLEQLRGETVLTVHDLDKAGESGAMWVESENGKRPGWATSIALVAKESKNLTLELTGPGKDVRDFLNEKIQSGLSPLDAYHALVALAEKCEPIAPPEGYSIEQLTSDDEESIDAEEESLRHHVDDPYRLAVSNLEHYQAEYGRRLRYWNQTWYRYRTGVYQEITSDHLNSRLTAAIKREFDAIWRKEYIAYKAWKKSKDYDPDEDKGPPKVRKIKSSLVNDVYIATKGLCVMDASQKMHDWVCEEESHEGICIACENGILNITKAISETEYPMDEILIPHRTTWFSTSKLNFPFDADAQCPNWIKFLNDVFNDDEESIDVLQKWFGYLLTPDNSLNKILFVIGQPRSGKGTIVQVMKELFGESNVAAPKLTDLSRDFGLQTLANKTVAIIPDARLSKRADETMIMETLLSISGGDPQDVARKFKESLSSYQMKTRFTIFSNLVPNLKDLSTAFISRCIFLSMPNSYLNREDYGLQDRLKAELSGILNWAIVGRHNLNQSKRIKQPANGVGLLEELKALTSPLLVFLESSCELSGKEEDWIDTKEFFEHWSEWCKENEIEHTGNMQTLGRKIKAINPSVETVRYRQTNSSYSRKLTGIKIKPNEDQPAY